MQISGFIFDLDGTLANTADLKTERRKPWDVLSIADNFGKDALKFKIDGLDTGLGQILAELLQHGVPVAVVSRAPSSYVSTLLWLLGYDFLAFRAGGVGVSQAQRIKQICEDLEIDIASAVYVGDTEDDREAARQVGCRFASPFWNPKSITQNDLWENWSDVTPTFYPSDISPTMRHLISTQMIGNSTLPEYELHVVVKRILNDCISVTDIAWLEASPYKYWEILAKEKTGKPTPPMPKDISPPHGRWQDEVFDRMETVLNSGDLARVLTLKPEKVVWFFDRHPETMRRFFSQARRDEAIVNISILYALMESGFLPENAYGSHTYIPSLVQWSLQKFGHRPPVFQLLRRSSLKKPTSKQFVSYSELKTPKIPIQPDALHYSSVSQYDREYEYWLEEDFVISRNRYDQDCAFLEALIIGEYQFPIAVPVDHLYSSIPYVRPEEKRINAFIPYRNANGPGGQDFWIPIKDWGRGYSSGPEVHLHYIEQIALIMARNIALRDPLGRKPLFGMPSHPASEAKPAAASMRLAKRIGEILDREIHWPLMRIDDEFVVNPKFNLPNSWTGVFIDDQLTTGKTYQNACEALGYAPELLVWSCSRLSDAKHPGGFAEPF